MQEAILLFQLKYNIHPADLHMMAMYLLLSKKSHAAKISPILESLISTFPRIEKRGKLKR